MFVSNAQKERAEKEEQSRRSEIYAQRKEYLKTHTIAETLKFTKK